MGVPGDDQRGVHVGEHLGPALGRRDPGDQLLVAARGGVAEEHAVDDDAQGQLAQRAGALGAELLRGERRHLGGVVALRGPRSVDRRRRLALAVAAHPVHVSAQRLQAVKGGAGKRAGHDIAADDDRVRARRPRIGQHRLQGVGVAVDVIQGEDPHEPKA